MTRSPAKKQVFDSDFLEWLAERNRGGPAYSEAGAAGRWTVRRRPSGFAVVREPDEREMPDAELSERETALLVAAIYPALEREQPYELTASAGALGADVRAVAGGRPRKVGWLRHRHPEILEALSVVEWLLRSPASLALVLEAASPEVLAGAGQILERRLNADQDEAPEPDGEG